ARRGSGTGGSQRVQRARRRRVALAGQRWALTAIDEQVIEGDATQERGIDRVNQGEALAELAPSSLCHLEVVALLQLAAGLQNSQAALVPASDVLRLEARRQHEVQPEDMIEPAVLKDRLRWEQLDDPAVHVEVTTDRYRLDEERQRHRYAHQLADRQLGRVLGAEVLDTTEVHVVDNRGDREAGVADAHAPQPLVEQMLERLALHQPREPLQGAQREAGNPRPLDVEVALAPPRKGEVGHLLRAHPGRPHRAPDGAARARGVQRGADPRLLEGPCDTHHRDAPTAAA